MQILLKISYDREFRQKNGTKQIYAKFNLARSLFKCLFGDINASSKNFSTKIHNIFLEDILFFQPWSKVGFLS